MRRSRQSQQGGFTIVETLIVLATAGLILLIVLLAIPALQRNSRNNERKGDVQAILSAISQYGLNNSGNFPANCGDIIGAGQASCTSALAGAPNDYFLRYMGKNLRFYTDPGQVKLLALLPDTPGYRSVTDGGGVAVFNYQKCRDDGQSTSQGAGYRDVVALCALETNSGTQRKCEQL
jgi:type II secretory pathway pseudopilin PulG